MGWWSRETTGSSVSAMRSPHSPKHALFTSSDIRILPLALSVEFRTYLNNRSTIYRVVGMYRQRLLMLVILLGVVLGLGIFFIWRPGAESMKNEDGLIPLPQPMLRGTISVEEAISSRRSRRDFKPDPLAASQVAQLLWAGQGITGEGWKRAAPSAGATYPARLFLIVGENGVEGMGAGVYEYLPNEHALRTSFLGDVRDELAQAALAQGFIAEAPISIVIAMDYSRTTKVYGQRGVRYVDMEAGHIGENLYLQAESLRLGTVIVGAFDDDEVSSVLRLPRELSPVAIMPFGRPR